MIVRVVLGTLLLAALVGCGGEGAGPTTSEPASEPSTPEPSTSEAGAALPDPCDLVTDREATRILGDRREGSLIEGTGLTAGAATCSFGSGPQPEDPSLDVIVTDASGADFDSLLRQYSVFPGIEEEELDVEGVDGAALLVEEDEILTTVTAVVLVDDVSLTLLGSAPDVDEARRVAVEGTDAALAS